MPKKWGCLTIRGDPYATVIESMTVAEADYVRQRFRSRPEYADLALAFPKVEKVLNELPDFSNAFMLIYEIQTMMADAVCEIRQLKYGSLKF
jgi:hypothetical protein